nr:MAG TPA: hypothetical protein [Caudoviricetes sp.]
MPSEKGKSGTGLFFMVRFLQINTSLVLVQGCAQFFH